MCNTFLYCCCQELISLSQSTATFNTRHSTQLVLSQMTHSTGFVQWRKHAKNLLNYTRLSKKRGSWINQIVTIGIDLKSICFIVNPGLDWDKVSDKTGDGALEDGIIAQDDMLIADFNQVLLKNHWKQSNISWQESGKLFPDFQIHSLNVLYSPTAAAR